MLIVVESGFCINVWLVILFDFRVEVCDLNKLFVKVELVAVIGFKLAIIWFGFGSISLLMLPMSFIIYESGADTEDISFFPKLNSCLFFESSRFVNDFCFTNSLKISTLGAADDTEFVVTWLFFSKSLFEICVEDLSLNMDPLEIDAALIENAGVVLLNKLEK